MPENHIKLPINEANFLVGFAECWENELFHAVPEDEFIRFMELCNKMKAELEYNEQYARRSYENEESR